MAVTAASASNGARRRTRNLFWFFQFQVLFSMLLSISFAAVAWSPAEPGSLCTAAAAVLIWLLSVAG